MAQFFESPFKCFCAFINAKITSSLKKPLVLFFFTPLRFLLLLCRVLFPYGLSVISLPIGQALADDAFNARVSAFHVIYAKPDAIAIAEIVFCEIAVQMLFAAMLVDALHAALEDRIVALDRVGADNPVAVVPHIFVIAVGDGFVAGKLLADVLIVSGFIGHQRAFARHVVANDVVDLCNAGFVDVETTRAAAALYESEDGVLMSPTTAAFLLAFNATDEGFVRLDNFARAAHRGYADNAHGFADAMRHEPCGLEGDAQGAGSWLLEMPFLPGAKQIHRLQPQVHRDVTILEHGPDFHGELFAALVALVEADTGRFTLHLADAIKPAAMRANRAVRPYASFNPSESDGLVLEDSLDKIDLAMTPISP